MQTHGAEQSGGITVRDIYHQYRGQEGALAALEGINLDIRPGSFTIFVGPSGCGKSTLCRLIAGLDSPTRGDIQIDGKTVHGPGNNRVLIFQDAALFPWLTVQENVLFGLRMQRMARPDALEHAANCLRLVQLSRFARSYPHELSGGMRQRVALARALAVRPRVLLMDEPFGALDAQTREILLYELLRIWQATQTTLVYVTHNITEAAILGTSTVIFTARPGRVKRVIAQDYLPRPRLLNDPAVLQLTEVIHDELREEIERVEREEFDLEWHLDTRPPARCGSFELGDGI
ncbi:MAG: ABC transporter ATP-binding protein [Armatimonadota bacterium]